MNGILTLISADKNHILDSWLAGVSIAGLVSFLEGPIKLIGYVLSLILLLRAGLGFYRDRLEIKSKKLEIEIKQKQLRQLE